MVFGSRANGRARPDSDLDLTVRLSDLASGDDWHDDELGLLIENAGRWGRELTALLSVEVKDILLEYDPGRIGNRQGRDNGVLLMDRIGVIYPDKDIGDW